MNTKRSPSSAVTAAFYLAPHFCLTVAVGTEQRDIVSALSCTRSKRRASAGNGYLSSFKMGQLEFQKRDYAWSTDADGGCQVAGEDGTGRVRVVGENGASWIGRSD